MNLRAIVARSIGIRSISTSARRKCNESRNGGSCVNELPQEPQMLDSGSGSSVLGIFSVWTAIGFNMYTVSDMFQIIRLERLRSEPIKLNAEELETRGSKGSKEDDIKA